MNKNQVAIASIVVVAIVALAASIVYLHGGDDSSAPELPEPAELASYSDGVYDGTVEGDTISFKIADLSSCGTSDMVLFGSKWLDMANPLVVGNRIVELIESRVTVATTDPSIFGYLKNLYPYSYADGASVAAIALDVDNGYTYCYSGIAPTEKSVISGLASWMDDHMGYSREYFIVGASWDARVMAVTDYDLGEWGHAMLASYYGNKVNSNVEYASAHTLMFYKDGGLRLDGASVEYKVDPDTMLMNYAPAGSTMEFDHIDYRYIGTGLHQSNLIYWISEEVKYRDQSSMSDGVFNVEYDLSDRLSTYQVSFTYGLSSYLGPAISNYDESGSLGLNISGHDSSRTVEMRFVSSIPFPSE